MFVENSNSIPVVSMSAGRIAQWLVCSGDKVEQRQGICVVALRDGGSAVVEALEAGVFKSLIARYSLVGELSQIGYIKVGSEPGTEDCRVTVRLSADTVRAVESFSSTWLIGRDKTLEALLHAGIEAIRAGHSQYPLQTPKQGR